MANVQSAAALKQLGGAVTISQGKLTGNVSLNHTIQPSYAVGASAGQVDTIHSKTLTIASAAAPQVLQITTAGGLTDINGSAINLLHANELLVENLDAAQTITLSPLQIATPAA